MLGVYVVKFEPMLFSLWLTVFILCRSAFALGPPVYTVVAKSGDPAPDIPGATFQSLQNSNAVINEQGTVAFRAQVQLAAGFDGVNHIGIWVGPPGNLRLAARQGDPVPGLDTNLTIRSLPPLTLYMRMDASGQIAFNAQLAGPGITFDNDTCLLAGQPGNLRVVAREGNPAPGLPATYLLGDLGSLNATDFVVGLPGQTALRARLRGAATLPDDAAIWLESANGLERIVWEGMPVPGFPGGVNFKSVYLSVPTATACNPAGELAFVAELEGPGFDLSNNASLWVATTNGLDRLLNEGDGLGLPVGLSYSRFGDVTMNVASQLCFVAGLDGATHSNDSAIVTGFLAALDIFAREGDLAPGTTNNTVFADLTLVHPVLGAGGEVVFASRVEGPSVGTTNNWGIWSGPPGDLRLVSRRGDPAPGLGDDVVFHELFSQTFDLPTINRHGELFYRTHVQGPGIGLDNNQVLWAGTPGFIRPIMQRADFIDLGGGDVRKVFSFRLVHGSGGQDGRTGSFNDARQLLIETVFVPGQGLGGSAIMLMENVIDPDANEVPEILEAWFGLASGESVEDIIPHVRRVGQDTRVVYRCRTDVAVGELILQRSTDLRTWETLDVTPTLDADQSGLPPGVKRLSWPFPTDGLPYYYRVAARR